MKPNHSVNSINKQIWNFFKMYQNITNKWLECSPPSPVPRPPHFPHFITDSLIVDIRFYPKRSKYRSIFMRLDKKSYTTDILR